MPNHKEFLQSKGVQTLRGYVRFLNLHNRITRYSSMKKKALEDQKYYIGASILLLFIVLTSMLCSVSN